MAQGKRYAESAKLVDKTKLNIISVSRIAKDKRFWKNENYM